jgi:hypothetical protein
MRESCCCVILFFPRRQLSPPAGAAQMTPAVAPTPSVVPAEDIIIRGENGAVAVSTHGNHNDQQTGAEGLCTAACLGTELIQHSVLDIVEGANALLEAQTHCWGPKCVVGCDLLFAVSTANPVDFAVEKQFAAAAAIFFAV